MKPLHQPFYLFGMGNRRKLLYRGGALFDALSGEMLRSWQVMHEQILPSEYTVRWKSREGKDYSLSEDENGVSLKVEGTQTFLTGSSLRLPNFQGHRHAPLLRTLLHEVLINVNEGRPLTNFFADSRPSFRDAALIVPLLRDTGNLPLVKDWILGLNEGFDTRSGELESDALGQALFLISLASDAGHPLVARVLEAAERLRVHDYLGGMSAGGEHPVYQTKWLKHGLRSLGLEDGYKFPVVFDPYAAVFWMDFRETGSNGPPFSEKVKETTPHLAWAEAHFHGWDPPVFSGRSYPLTWEMRAGDLPGLTWLQTDEERKLVAPQARHAAEMLLYFLDESPEFQARRKEHGILQTN